MEMLHVVQPTSPPLSPSYEKKKVRELPRNHCEPRDKFFRGSVRENRKNHLLAIEKIAPRFVIEGSQTATIWYRPFLLS